MKNKLILILSLFFALTIGAQNDSTQRTPPSPLQSLPFPSADWANSPIIGINSDAPDYTIQKITGLAKKKSRIKVYGWVDPSYTFSTSKTTTIPVAYNIIPNSFQLDQAVIRVERQPNTVQTDHVDWGFRLSNVYGLDYRYTVAKGWFSDQYFKKNNLYGYDCPEAYLMLYVPKVAQGMLIKVGRYIAPADIEAQLSPDNYLFSHSVIFSYDAYTFTGFQATIKLNRQTQIMFGAHGGNDNAPWTNTFNINGQAMIRWVSKTNNDGLWAGVSSIGANPTYKNGHDDIQQINGVWGHKFNKILHMQTEAYLLWEKNAAMGGSASNGPFQYNTGGGPGMTIPGMSHAVGLLNYFQILTSSKSYISIRNDYMNDMNGWRTGFATTYTSHTIGFIYAFTNWLMIRPEVRYDRSWGTNRYVYDMGTKKDQVTISSDILIRF